MPNDSGYTLEIVKIRGSCNWAIRATINGETRYRGFYYKKDALYDLEVWLEAGVDRRNFNHNFNTAEELNIREV